MIRAVPSIDAKSGLVSAVQCLQRGGVVAYPTEAVYGLGCDPLQQAAVEKLLSMKQRSVSQGLILLAAHSDMLAAFIDYEAMPALCRQRLSETWPGPVTWVCPASKQVPAWIKGRFSTIAVRVSAHPVASALSSAFSGPIVSTSANQAGQSPAMNAIDVMRYFDNAIDCILEGELGGQHKPTEIRDALSNTVIRPA